MPACTLWFAFHLLWPPQPGNTWSAVYMSCRGAGSIHALQELVACHKPPIACETQVVRQVNQGTAADGPPLGRILLQTGQENTGKFQEAVAEALASQLQARVPAVSMIVKAIVQPWRLLFTGRA